MATNNPGGAALRFLAEQTARARIRSVIHLQQKADHHLTIREIARHRLLAPYCWRLIGAKFPEKNSRRHLTRE